MNSMTLGRYSVEMKDRIVLATSPQNGPHPHILLQNGECGILGSTINIVLNSLAIRIIKYSV